jgi:hypothetical protein
VKIPHLTPPLETYEVSDLSDVSAELTGLTDLTVPEMSDVVSDAPRPAERDYVLYRFLASSERLLYVGRTIDPPTRWHVHSVTKDWWPAVVRIEIERFDSAGQLAEAELTAIRAEAPIFNIVFNQIKAAPTRRNPSTPVRPVEQRLVKWLAATGRTEFTVREALQAFKGGAGGAIRRRADLMPHLDDMENGGIIRRIPSPRTDSIRYALVGRCP